jgi:hypothetical protein
LGVAAVLNADFVGWQKLVESSRARLLATQLMRD